MQQAKIGLDTCPVCATMGTVVEKNSDFDRWLTPQEVADLKGWKLDTVRKMMQRGKFGETRKKGPVTLIDRYALAGIEVRPYNRAASEDDEE